MCILSDVPFSAHAIPGITCCYYRLGRTSGIYNSVIKRFLLSLLSHLNKPKNLVDSGVGGGWCRQLCLTGSRADLRVCGISRHQHSPRRGRGDQQVDLECRALRAAYRDGGGYTHCSRH